MATAVADKYTLRVIDHIVLIHPKQVPSTGWRWGPHWEAEDGEGVWVISRINITHGPVAIRLQYDDQTPEIEYREFTSRLQDLVDGSEDVDERLRALDAPRPAPRRRRAAVPKVIAADLAALNELARNELRAES